MRAFKLTVESENSAREAGPVVLVNERGQSKERLLRVQFPQFSDVSAGSPSRKPSLQSAGSRVSITQKWKGNASGAPFPASHSEELLRGAAVDPILDHLNFVRQ
jgi:hypothetical protein